MTQKLISRGRPFYKARYESGLCESCSHQDSGHREKSGVWKVVETADGPDLVQGPNGPALIFYCNVDGCGCVIDKASQ